MCLFTRKTTVSDFAFRISLISSRPVQLRPSAPKVVEHWLTATLSWYVHLNPISRSRSFGPCTQPSLDAIGVDASSSAPPATFTIYSTQAKDACPKVGDGQPD